jgi:hypothetical protein
MTRFGLGFATLIGFLLRSADSAPVPLRVPYEDARPVLKAMREALPAGLAGLPDDRLAAA